MSVLEKLKIYDNLGTLLSVAGLFCGVMAVNFGGTLYAWKSGQIIALFALSGALLIAFGLQQTYKFMTSFEGRLLPVQLIPQKEPFLLFVLMAANNCASMIGMVSKIRLTFPSLTLVRGLIDTSITSHSSSNSSADPVH